MAKLVILPKLGQTMEEGVIVEWFKQEGDAVKRGEALFAVESDKATLESEAPARGYLRKILVPAGVSTPVLTPVAVIARTLDEDISASLAPVDGGEGQVESDVQEGQTARSAAGDVQVAAAPAGRVFASPRARMRAKELGVDLGAVSGSGPNGRVVEKDVLAYLERQPKATPVAIKMARELGVDLGSVTGTGVGGKVLGEDVQVAAQKAALIAAPPVLKPATISTPRPLSPAQLPAAGVATTQPMTGLRGIIAERMATSARTTAHVTLFSDVDATAFVEVRTQLKNSVAAAWGFAPGYNDLLGLIVARALREFPYMNARVNGDVIEQLENVNVGMAVDTGRGLLVPVIHDADRLGLQAFGAEFRTLVERARAGKSLPDDFAGGTFTITNLGMYGVDAFTPIINLPEAAILGVGRIVARPVVREGQVVVRQMMTLSLAFDHRLVDGAPAARFLQRIGQLVEQPYLLLG